MTVELRQISEAQGELTQVASLGMYDAAPVQAANDRLWAAITEHLSRDGVDVPPRLTRDRDLGDIWRDPHLLLAQTCGYPLTTSLKDAVQVVATPLYAAPGCVGALHRSAIIVRARSGIDALEDLRGRRCVINSHDSNTGMNLLRAEVAPLAREGRFFGSVEVSGSHAASAVAVAAGQADVAAVDAVTWALLKRHQPSVVAGLKVVAWTRPSPGLPLITAATTPAEVVAALRRALQAVADDPALTQARDALLLDGFAVLPTRAYDRISELEHEAAHQGYSALA